MAYESDKQFTTLVWSDEFDCDGAPNPDKWTFATGGTGFGNNEDQFYTDRPENAYVKDGKLIIRALKEDFENRHYTSAKLISRDKGDWLYGRFDISAKLPTGNGIWPAIWMLPTKWEYGGWPRAGEIDIMEQVGFDPLVIHGSIHTQKFNHKIRTERTAVIEIATATEAFHTYSVIWQPEHIDFLVDDNLYYSVERGGGFADDEERIQAWPFDKPFHMILNVAVGGFWGGAKGIDDSIFPQQMEIEYVRVYG